MQSKHRNEDKVPDHSKRKAPTKKRSPTRNKHAAVLSFCFVDPNLPQIRFVHMALGHSRNIVGQLSFLVFILDELIEQPCYGANQSLQHRITPQLLLDALANQLASAQKPRGPLEVDLC